MFKEFKEFAMKGNVLDLAIGLIMIKVELLDGIYLSNKLRKIISS